MGIAVHFVNLLVDTSILIPTYFQLIPKKVECQNYKNIYQRTALYMENNNYCTTSNILLTHRKLIPMWIHHMHAGCANMFEHERDGFDRSYIYKAAFMMQ